MPPSHYQIRAHGKPPGSEVYFSVHLKVGLGAPWQLGADWYIYRMRFVCVCVCVREREREREGERERESKVKCNDPADVLLDRLTSLVQVFHKGWV